VKRQSDMAIPKVIHQLWRTSQVPPRWRRTVASVQRYHPGWEYRLWTDYAMELHVRRQHPRLYPIYMGFNRNIMRVDVFRYVLMHDFGGLYCDLDYEFLRPYDYGTAALVLSLERDIAYGDPENCVANYFVASIPRHQFWQDVLEEIIGSPPTTGSFHDVVQATGPGLLTRVLLRDPARYADLELTPQPVFSPQRVHGPRERKIYLNSGITYGFHHGWGTWKERWRLDYLIPKVCRLMPTWAVP